MAGRFSLMKIIKTVPTRCHILKLKCKKFDFSWDSVPDHSGEITALPQAPYVDLRGPTSKGEIRGGIWEEREKGRRIGTAYQLFSA